MSRYTYINYISYKNIISSKDTVLLKKFNNYLNFFLTHADLGEIESITVIIMEKILEIKNNSDTTKYKIIYQEDEDTEKILKYLESNKVKLEKKFIRDNLKKFDLFKRKFEKTICSDMMNEIEKFVATV